MDSFFTQILSKIDPVNGFIFVILSIIFITFLKIIDTVQDTSKSSLAEIKKQETIETSRVETIGEHFRVIEGEVSDDYGIELSKIPLSNTVSFTEAPVSPPVEENLKKVFTDSFSFLQDQLSQDEDVQTFVLFTNPQHIFSGALKEIFAKKVTLLLNQLELYKFQKYPFYKFEENHIQRLFLEEKPDILIEELFELWRLGYSHPALPEIFIHYFFSINSDKAIHILKSIIHHNILETRELKRICFLYQDILAYNIDFSELQEALPEKISDAFDLSNILINKNLFLTRKRWQNWEEYIFIDLEKNRAGVFYNFYFDLLEHRTSLNLYYFLIHRFKHILSTPWRKFIERQAFYYGHYEKLNRLAFIPPEYVSLISKSQAQSILLVNDLIVLLKNKPFFELHKFLVYYINHSRDLQKYEIPAVQLKELLQKLELKHSDKDYVPQAIRFILYLYYYEKKDLSTVNYITPYIHGRIGKFIPKLYQVRILYKNKQFEQAWQEINELWNHDEENMLLMNEAAIYAYQSGRIEEAEELFARLRRLYPDNVQIVHNEAVFLQHKARLLTERKKISQMMNDKVAV